MLSLDILYEKLENPEKAFGVNSDNIFVAFTLLNHGLNHLLIILSNVGTCFETSVQVRLEFVIWAYCKKSGLEQSSAAAVSFQFTKIYDEGFIIR